jgi:hypothetical protein
MRCGWCSDRTEPDRRLAKQANRINVNVQCQRGPDTFPYTGPKDSAEGEVDPEVRTI